MLPLDDTLAGSVFQCVHTEGNEMVVCVVAASGDAATARTGAVGVDIETDTKPLPDIDTLNP